jgi:chromosome segregation ATPase
MLYYNGTSVRTKSHDITTLNVEPKHLFYVKIRGKLKGVIVWMNEQILMQILSEVKDIRTDQLEMKVEIKEMKADIQGIKSEIKEMKAEIKEMKADQLEMKAEIKEIKSEIKEMKAEIKEIKSDQLEMKAEIKEIKVDIQQIKQAVMETNEAVRRIELNQEQQQRIIELLSFRSIEHEAMLKRFYDRAV